MNGMLSMSMHQQRTAVEFLARAMEVLKWGNQTYENVHNLDRGCIFEPTFIRGVARLQITAIHSVRFILNNFPKMLIFSLRPGVGFANRV
jgi:hypothetical protein